MSWGRLGENSFYEYSCDYPLVCESWDGLARAVLLRTLTGFPPCGHVRGFVKAKCIFAYMFRLRNLQDFPPGYMSLGRRDRRRFYANLHDCPFDCLSWDRSGGAEFKNIHMVLATFAYLVISVREQMLRIFMGFSLVCIAGSLGTRRLRTYLRDPFSALPWISLGARGLPISM